MQALTDVLPFVLVFAAVALFVLAVGSLIPAADSVRRRLTSAQPERETRKAALRGQNENPIVRAVLTPFERYAPADADGRPSALRLTLIRAGFFSPKAPAAYYAIRTLLGLGFAAGASPFLAGHLSSGLAIVAVLMFGLLGFMLPAFVVSRRVESRQRTVRESFPDALDMLLMCVEAGVGLDEAVNRVAEELKIGSPLLGFHFDLLSAELRAGKTRENAFRSFSDRIGIDEIRSFVALLMQTEALGTSMAETLRSMSDDMRQRRLLRAEELAQKVGTKLSVILAIFLLPVLISVIVAPATIKGIHAFQQVHRR